MGENGYGHASCKSCGNFYSGSFLPVHGQNFQLT